ncbi:DUF302 domain-containing protein [Nocardia sp. 004]|uniref:DUF302 domain-containing protein n=1 Tax=Nocardia sp. 004 TaxID=3385978 RepID=UPI0039A04726
MPIAIATTATHADFDTVAGRTREVLREHGFGVLTEIDVQETLRQKLGATMEHYLILGACNPALAHAALGADKQIGVLLPCNVVVRADPDNPTTIHIEAMNPQLLTQGADHLALQSVADKATEQLSTAVATLAEELA